MELYVLIVRDDLWSLCRFRDFVGQMWRPLILHPGLRHLIGTAETMFWNLLVLPSVKWKMSEEISETCIPLTSTPVKNNSSLTFFEDEVSFSTPQKRRWPESHFSDTDIESPEKRRAIPSPVFVDLLDESISTDQSRSECSPVKSIQYVNLLDESTSTESNTPNKHAVCLLDDSTSSTLNSFSRSESYLPRTINLFDESNSSKDCSCDSDFTISTVKESKLTGSRTMLSRSAEPEFASGKNLVFSSNISFSVVDFCF